MRRRNLALVTKEEGYQQNYEYLMAQANIFRQRQATVQALAAFARADAISGDDRSAEQAQYELASAEGRQITPTFSIGSEGGYSPIFEDINIYQMDAKLLGATTANLPLPRASSETLAREGYHLRMYGLARAHRLRGRTQCPGYDFVSQRRVDSGAQYLRHRFQHRHQPHSSPRIGQFPVQYRHRIHVAPRYFGADRPEPESLPPVSLHVQHLVIQLAEPCREAPSTRPDHSPRRTSIPAMPPPTSISRWAGPGEKPPCSPVTGCVTSCSVPLIREYFTTDMYAGVQRNSAKICS